MATSRSLTCAFAVFVFFILQVFTAQAQIASSPAPSPTSDGSTLDIGIAYGLLVVALFVTYFMHPIDAFPFNLL